MCSAVREFAAAAGLITETGGAGLRNGEDIDRSLRINQLSTTPYSDATQVNRGFVTVSQEGFVTVGHNEGLNVFCPDP